MPFRVSLRASQMMSQCVFRSLGWRESKRARCDISRENITMRQFSHNKIRNICDRPPETMELAKNADGGGVSFLLPALRLRLGQSYSPRTAVSRTLPYCRYSWAGPIRPVSFLRFSVFPFTFFLSFLVFSFPFFSFSHLLFFPFSHFVFAFLFYSFFLIQKHFWKHGSIFQILEYFLKFGILFLDIYDHFLQIREHFMKS